MPSLLQSIAVLGIAAVSACSVEQVSNVAQQERTGPPFAEAFADMSVLVSGDAKKVRQLLNTVQLPNDKQHHDDLKALLAKTERLDTDHLLLLTEAVALPWRQGGPVPTNGVTITTINGRVTVSGRGKGEFHPVVDELLLAGASKVTNPSPANFGRLIAVTQTKETVVQLSGMLRDGWDNGSTSDLQKILSKIRKNGIREELCVHGLMPQGRLGPDRVDTALESMSFDSSRLALLQADYQRRDSIPTDTLLRHLKAMSFDGGRNAVVNAAVDHLKEISGAQLIQLVKNASFDSGRQKIAKSVAPKLAQLSGAEALKLMKTCSFDAGRQKMIELLRPQMQKLSGSEQDAVISAFSFSSGKDKARQLLGGK